LKSTLIPAAGIMLAGSFLFRASRPGKKGRDIREMALISGLIAMFLLPWMLSMYRSSGTLLYPILGRGYNGFGHAAYGAIPEASVLAPQRLLHLIGSAVLEPSSIALLVIGTCYLAGGAWLTDRSGVGLFLFAGAFVGKMALALIMQGWWVDRLSFAFVFSAILILLTEVLSEVPDSGIFRQWTLAAAAAAGIYAGGNWNSAIEMYRDSFKQAYSAMRGNASLISEVDRRIYRQFQQSTSAGSTILAKVENPFLFDFNRNQVFVVDSAGPGPPPGLPLFKGAESLAAYLVSHAITYVAYSYGATPEFSRGLARVFLPGQPPGIRVGGEQTADFLRSLDELSGTRRRIYDDGRNLVIDLHQRTQQ
jgi:hypothetical protein